MKENPYPIGAYSKVYEHDSDALGICSVIADDSSNIPILCETLNQETMFLSKRKKMWVTTAGYEALKEAGHKVKFLYGYETKETAYIFEDFINDLFSKRLKAKENNDEVWNFTYKLLMNSLYGKFGQRDEKKVYYINVGTEAHDELIPITMDEQFTFMKEKHRNIFVVPSISSFVTEYAKLHLRSYLTRLYYDDLIYCDTDSVYSFSNRLENSKKLGKMKLEAIARPFFVVKPKLYMAGDIHENKYKIKAKGVPQHEINPLNFYRFLNGEQIVSRRGLRKFKSSIKEMERTGKFVKRNQIKRAMRSVYTKRRMKGLTTVPFKLEEKGKYYSQKNEIPYRKFLEQLLPLVCEIAQENS